MAKSSTKFANRLFLTKPVPSIPTFIRILNFILLVGFLVSLPVGYVLAQTTISTTPTAGVSATPPLASTPNAASQSDLLLLQAQLQNQAQQLQQAQQDAFDAKNSAGAAVTLSLIAILFGIVGLVIGALAILRSRARPARNTESTEIEAG